MGIASSAVWLLGGGDDGWRGCLRRQNTKPTVGVVDRRVLGAHFAGQRQASGALEPDNSVELSVARHAVLHLPQCGLSPTNEWPADLHCVPTSTSASWSLTRSCMVSCGRASGGTVKVSRLGIVPDSEGSTSASHDPAGLPSRATGLSLGSSTPRERDHDKGFNGLVIQQMAHHHVDYVEPVGTRSACSAPSGQRCPASGATHPRSLKPCCRFTFLYQRTESPLAQNATCIGNTGNISPSGSLAMTPLCPNFLLSKVIRKFTPPHPRNLDFSPDLP